MTSIKKQKEKLMEHYTKCLSNMISDADFYRYFSPEIKDKIIKYSDLANYQSIYQLLPKKNDFCIILTEMKENEGHWCSLLRYPYKGKDCIEWFDSYGVRPDGELDYIPSFVKKMLGENTHYLSGLIQTIDPSTTDFVYNKSKLQALQDGINTCGRWVICRILMMQFGYNLEEFDEFIHRQSHDLEKPPDILMCDWIK
jgi:hypothetical protein